MAADSAALFAEHQQPLIRYLCRAVGADEARDLAQDVFLRISRTQVPAGTNREIRAWVFRIARNLVLDHYRRRARRPATVAAETAASRPASQDVALAVNEALAALADLDRDVFLMREVSGLGYEEIATACDLTADAVRSRIHRARLDLRTRLEAPITTHRKTALKLLGR